MLPTVLRRVANLFTSICGFVLCLPPVLCRVANLFTSICGFGLCLPPVFCKVANFFTSICGIELILPPVLRRFGKLNLYFWLWVYVFLLWLLCVVCLPPVWRRVANLTVSNCNIERLYGDVFRNLNVTRLIISVGTVLITYYLCHRGGYLYMVAYTVW